MQCLTAIHDVHCLGPARKLWLAHLTYTHQCGAVLVRSSNRTQHVHACLQAHACSCIACRLCMQQCKSWWMQQAVLEYRSCVCKKPGQCHLHSALGRGSGWSLLNLLKQDHPPRCCRHMLRGTTWSSSTRYLSVMNPMGRPSGTQLW